uniref:Dynein light chain n=1 Tax=Loa loa TaxID=7209 RepID=A0A1I7VJA1_LOALO
MKHTWIILQWKHMKAQLIQFIGYRMLKVNRLNIWSLSNHSGRSDEFVPMEEKKPSVDVGEVFTDAAQALGAKITGLFKRVPLIWIIQHQPYDGPLLQQACMDVKESHCNSMLAFITVDVPTNR